MTETMQDLLKKHTDAIEAKFGKLGLDELQTRLKTAENALFTLEQKEARPRGGSDVPDTPGGQFVKHMEELSGIAQASSRGQRQAFGIEIKSTITTASGSGGGLINPDRDPDISPIARRPLRVRNLLPVMPISTSSVEVPKQTTRTNNAATVAEGSLKPESALGWTLATVTPKVIAHWIPASKQILEDAPQLRALIDDELLFGLGDKEDTQILAGDGTGENLLGLIPQATAYSAPFVLASANKIDRVGSALLQVALANYTPTGIVMHPSDWLRIKLAKDAAGGYIASDPVSGAFGATATANAMPMLWGVPVVPTVAMAAGKYLVGDFARAAKLYDRWVPRIEVSTEHADFFVRNMVAILCEERIALAVKRGEAMVYGDFSADA